MLSDHGATQEDEAPFDNDPGYAEIYHEHPGQEYPRDGGRHTCGKEKTEDVAHGNHEPNDGGPVAQKLVGVVQ